MERVRTTSTCPSGSWPAGLPTRSLRYDAVRHAREETALAREKNTDRSAARRRARAAARRAQAADLTEEEVVQPAPAPEERRPLLRLPNVREDVRLLPRIFAQRRLLWVPFLLAIVGFVAVLVFAGLGTDIQGLASLYISFFFVPPALFTYFIAGFLAPRASYLVGFVLAVFVSLLWAILAGGLGFLYVAEVGLVFLLPEDIRPTAVLQFAALSLVYGTLAAAFAGWYRDFLRRMNEQGRARRAAREAELARKRRDEKRSARRPAGSTR